MTEGENLRKELLRDIPDMKIDELLKRQSDYPYFQSLRFLYLKKLRQVSPERYAAALRENSIYASNREFLSRLLEGKEQSAGGAEADSFSLVDSYLTSHADELPSGKAEGIPVEVETAYRFEEGEPQEPSSSQFGLIDAFLEKSPQEKRLSPLPPQSEDAQEPDLSDNDGEELQKEEFLTESLAKTYIKQRRYAKALEIIRKLSLKYPEKNIYFVDQIRFLEKLTTNIKPE